MKTRGISKVSPICSGIELRGEVGGKAARIQISLRRSGKMKGGDDTVFKLIISALSDGVIEKCTVGAIEVV